MSNDIWKPRGIPQRPEVIAKLGISASWLVCSEPARREELFLWTAAILCAQNAIRLISAALSSAVSYEFASISIFQCLAWYAVFRLPLESESKRSSTRLDVTVAAALCLVSGMPMDAVLWSAATAVAIYFFATSADNPKLRAAATILGALAVQAFWGRGLFNLFAADLLRADAAVVGAVVAAMHEGVTRHDNVILLASGHGIEVLSGCSSFHNVSLALLCWVTVTKLNRPRLLRRDFLIGGIVCATMILLNEARLYAMALGPDGFHFWHDGFGATVFVFGASLTALLLSLYGSSARPRTA